MNRMIDPSRPVTVKGLLLVCALVAELALASSLAVGAPASAAFAAKPVSGAALSGVVNVNTATPEQLQLLPGVGEARAVAIVELRKQRGGFKVVDDLLSVRGIGESMLERMRPFVTVTGKTTARKL